MFEGRKEKEEKKEDEEGKKYFYLGMNIQSNVQFRAGRLAAPKRQTFVN